MVHLLHVTLFHGFIYTFKKSHYIGMTSITDYELLLMYYCTSLIS